MGGVSSKKNKGIAHENAIWQAYNINAKKRNEEEIKETSIFDIIYHVQDIIEEESI